MIPYSAFLDRIGELWALGGTVAPDLTSMREGMVDDRNQATLQHRVDVAVDDALLVAALTEEHLARLSRFAERHAREP